MKKEDIDKIVWWIPFKKLRNSIRNILEAEEKINNNNDMLLQYMKKSYSSSILKQYRNTFSRTL